MAGTWWKIVRREFRAILTIPVLRRSVLLAPLIFALFFGALYYRGAVQDMALAVVDQDNTPMSREVVAAFDSHEVMQVIYKGEDINRVKNMLYQGEVQMAIIIPPDLEIKATRGQGSEIQILIDGSNLFFTNNGVRAATEVVAQLSGTLGVKLLARCNLATNEAIRAMRSMTYTEAAWYNGGYSYAYFLTFGFIIYMVQLSLLIGTSLCVARDKAAGQWEELEASLPAAWLFCAKTLPYLLVAFAQMFLIFSAGNLILGLPLHGSLGWLALCTIIFLVVLALYGLFWSQFLTPLNAMRLSMVIGIPSMVFSGFTWPLAGMPGGIRYLCYIYPLTWYLEDFTAITMRGSGWAGIQHAFLVQVLILFIMLGANITVWLVAERRAWAEKIEAKAVSAL